MSLSFFTNGKEIFRLNCRGKIFNSCHAMITRVRESYRPIVYVHSDLQEQLNRVENCEWRTHQNPTTHLYASFEEHIKTLQ